MLTWGLFTTTALAAAPWSIQTLHDSLDITAGAHGDVASAVAVAGHAGTLWFTVEREALYGGTRVRQLHLGSVSCAPDWTGCGAPALVALGAPFVGRPSNAAIALELAPDPLDPPRVHVLRAFPSPSRCAAGASDLEAWVYDPAAGTSEVTWADVPAGCDDAGAASLRVDGDVLWGCWTRDARAVGADAEVWCGARDLSTDGPWSPFRAAVLAAYPDRAAFTVMDGGPLTAVRDRRTAPHTLALGWSGTSTGWLPGTPRDAGAPSIATAPDGSVHAVWLDGASRVQYAKCARDIDCSDPASWLVSPRPVRIGTALGSPEIAISDDGRMFVAWTEDTDPATTSDARRVFLKDKCLDELLFSPGTTPGEPLMEPATPSDDQGMAFGDPNLWTDPATGTVHVGFVEQDRAGPLPSHGAALWAHRRYARCESDPLPVEARITAFEAQAAAAGYTVQRGGFAFFAPGDCCVEDGDCYGNNPGGTYGFALLPPAPTQTSSDSGEAVDGAHPYFHLAPDEAVVLVGHTPPPSAYFGFRSHIGYRAYDGELAYVLTTNGPDLTSWQVARHRGRDDVSSEPLAVVTSADAAVEVAVHDLLERAGFLATEIEDDRIGADITRLGLGDLDDQLAIVHRAAVFDDPAAEAAYRANPGFTVLRLTPAAPPASPQPHGYPGWSNPKSGVDETPWLASLDALEAAILESAPEFTATPLSYFRGGAYPLLCLAQTITCGDLSSRFFARTGTFELPLDGSFAVAFGVNHARAGKALYSSFSAQAWRHNIGLESVDSRQMVGSARAYLPDDPLADDLYAVVLARDCLPFASTHCIEVPVGCPGVEEGDPLYGAARLYVDPITGTAPNVDEIIGDRLLVLTPPP